MLANIHFGIFYIPICYVKKQRLKHTKLYFYVLSTGVKLGFSQKEMNIY